MSTRKVTTVLLAASLAGAMFRRKDFDALCVPDPEFGGGSICGITRDPTARGFLFEEDKGGGGGGGVSFTPEQQAKVDEIVKGEKAKLNARLDEQKKLFDTQAAEFEKLKGQMSEFQSAADKAREEAENKGKSELDILKGNLEKASKRIEALTNEHKLALSNLETQLTAERGGRVEDAKRNWATQVMSSGAADGMSSYAINALLTEAQFEIDDNRQVTKVTFDGGVYEGPKAAEVAGAFYKTRPGFAKPKEGGSGHPHKQGGGGNGSGMDAHTSIAGAIGAGLAQRTG